VGGGGGLKIAMALFGRKNHVAMIHITRQKMFNEAGFLQEDFFTGASFPLKPGAQGVNLFN
jgi:hypothetical protein